VSWVRS